MKYGGLLVDKEGVRDPDQGDVVRPNNQLVQARLLHQEKKLSIRFFCFISKCNNLNYEKELFVISLNKYKVTKKGLLTHPKVLFCFCYI